MKMILMTQTDLKPPIFVLTYKEMHHICFF
jgi:hypothetical protein